ncbi:hypothetical protein [Roseibium album]|uniref:hypothetical protein n=1 Tax=Roseibium album TaxID=311410 RepID=UPI003BB04107
MELAVDERQTARTTLHQGAVARVFEAMRQEPAPSLCEDSLPPNTLLYASAANESSSLINLKSSQLEETLEPMRLGCSKVLETFGEALRNLIAFTSIIGRIGLEGEAHFVLANALQSKMAVDFAYCGGSEDVRRGQKFAQGFQGIRCINSGKKLFSSAANNATGDRVKSIQPHSELSWSGRT